MGELGGVERGETGWDIFYDRRIYFQLKIKKSICLLGAELALFCNTSIKKADTGRSLCAYDEHQLSCEFQSSLEYEGMQEYISQEEKQSRINMTVFKSKDN